MTCLYHFHVMWPLRGATAHSDGTVTTAGPVTDDAGYQRLRTSIGEEMLRRHGHPAQEMSMVSLTLLHTTED